MRIALIGPAHPYKGGGARHTTELAHRLAAAGHDVVIESWRAQYPARLYPGQQLLDVPEGEPYARTRRRLAWYRPDGWLAEGRHLASADLVVFALLTPLQVPAYLTILAALRRASDPLQPLLPHRPRTVVICHNVLPHERRLGDIALTRALLSRVDTVLVHSPAQAIQASDLAPAASVVTAQMPPHLPCSLGGDERRPLGGDDPPQTPPAHGSAGLSDEGELPIASWAGRLLFFGIVRPYKGLDVLLRALAAGPPNLTLTVAAADALVLPYREATASQNALLAFAHGVPVITTTAGALADLVRDGVDGLTCAPGDVADLARVLREISVPGTARRLRAGVTATDPAPYWADYLKALLAR